MEQHCAHTTVNMRVIKNYHKSGTRLGTVTESYSHLFPFFDRKQITYVKKLFLSKVDKSIINYCANTTVNMRVFKKILKIRYKLRYRYRIKIKIVPF